LTEIRDPTEDSRPKAAARGNGGLTLVVSVYLFVFAEVALFFVDFAPRLSMSCVRIALQDDGRGSRRSA
jgi:hypothetical protein